MNVCAEKDVRFLSLLVSISFSLERLSFETRKFSVLASLAGCQSPRIHFFPPTNAGVMGTCNHAQLSDMDVGTCLHKQVLLPSSHASSLLGFQLSISTEKLSTHLQPLFFCLPIV